VRAALFLSSSIDAQIALIPDDAFYYLVPARRFALEGIWSFDGVAASTGFHPLYAYLLAGVFRIAPDIGDASLFALLTGAATVLIAASAYLVSRAVARDFGAAGVLGVVLAFTAPIALRQQTLFVESCLVIFFSSALLALLSHGRDLPRLSKRWLAGALLIGLFGNLARSDFGVLSASCMAALWVLRGRSVGSETQLPLAAVATLGSGAGVALISLHTLYWSGSVIQSSARMKSHWGALRGYDVGGLIRWLVEFVAPRNMSWLGTRSGPLLVIGAGLLGVANGIRTRAARLDQWPLAAGCALCVAGYVVLYGRASSGVAPWYFANVLAALAYLLGGITVLIPGRVFVAAVAIVALCATPNTLSSLRPVWPHQTAMMSAGEFLRTHAEIDPVGSWNAGMISYFSRRPVTNLDGLINDEIYAYATTDRLLDYLCARGIRYVLDFADNVENPALAQRAGYADGRLRAALTEQRNFSNGDPLLQWTSTDLKLYRFDEAACRAH